ncbi:MULTISPECIES: molybdopterin molybdotransferase MoeA [Micromonospora]|uniref:Molybdopterin molybdenumtransferase n=1 Tax=Micromonospora solifontis TaxID=2487138 RepID=A0ABX9WID3_9ACTN|nr:MULTISPECIES: molybdopterin molybdotransferase MoeA [Micromonospora]NES17346.1 molybdopterin molybdotransferase MoeA [Micromonospora sp. PPF5-17B]NES36252.1 molybdopterin molybdotransferase MoeA [Micromonospora solifontis]NES59197.1 molybdopterin molybdotransferase MoeA [Micromonospora sp. PPF5-6]RNL99839.1 molybdopterin molybdenumtransferase MoeA [Micromonospora solifontis]
MSTETAAAAAQVAAPPPAGWEEARSRVYAVGLAAALPPVDRALADADGHTLAEPLTTRTDLPAFPTSSVDGWAVRGDGPWRVVGRVLAGQTPPPLAADGSTVEIATGAMVPAGATAILRVEESTRTPDGLVAGTPRPQREWREPGEEAYAGEELLPAGTPVDPAVIGLAASCGHDTLRVRRQPRAAVLVFGDELLTSGPPGAGRVRDALGPTVPAWLRRYGCQVRPADVVGPVADTLPAHVAALRGALASADLVCTTGGTMHGPVDHLHPTLEALGADYVVNTVAVRPGFPMLLARLVDDDGRVRFVAGLPGNPQSAVVALVSLVVPLLAGLVGRPMPVLPQVTLAEPIAGRGDYTHLALVRVDRAAATARPLRHVGSAMLRGLAGADGFAVIRPGTTGEAGARVPVVPLPLTPGERSW